MTNSATLEIRLEFAQARIAALIFGEQSEIVDDLYYNATSKVMAMAYDETLQQPETGAIPEIPRIFRDEPGLVKAWELGRIDATEYIEMIDAPEPDDRQDKHGQPASS